MPEPLFDPETGKLRDPDGLRSVGFSGSGLHIPRPVVNADGNKVTAFVHETEGGIGGYTTEHPSGRVDVNVHARAVKASTGTI